MISHAAYEHQVLASSVFRQAPPTIDEQNFIAILVFGVCTLVFQFLTQSLCDESNFNVLETLRVARSSFFIDQACTSFFYTNPLYAHILRRTALPNASQDPGLAKAIDAIELAISATSSHDDGREYIADINRRALSKLREWIISSQGQPRRWDQYCSWPAAVPPEYLELLACGDNLALLIFIYWAAVMHGTFKPFVKAWSRRSAFWAINQLHPDWMHLLGWVSGRISYGSIKGTGFRDEFVMIPTGPTGHFTNMDRFMHNGAGERG